LVGIVGLLESFSPLAFDSSHLLCYNTNLLFSIHALCAVETVHYKIGQEDGCMLNFLLLFLLSSRGLRLLKSLPIVKFCKCFILIFDLFVKLQGQGADSLSQEFLNLWSILLERNPILKQIHSITIISQSRINGISGKSQQ
jgi:hypothetical protein